MGDQGQRVNSSLWVSLELSHGFKMSVMAVTTPAREWHTAPNGTTGSMVVQAAGVVAFLPEGPGASQLGEPEGESLWDTHTDASVLNSFLDFPLISALFLLFLSCQAAVVLQAAFRGHLARARLLSGKARGSSPPCPPGVPEQVIPRWLNTSLVTLAAPSQDSPHFSHQDKLRHFAGLNLARQVCPVLHPAAWGSPAVVPLTWPWADSALAAGLLRVLGVEWHELGIQTFVLPR
jgi:hypothetical protein